MSGIFFCGPREIFCSPREARLPVASAVGAAALLLSVLASGCAPSKPAPPAVNLSGFPPAFRDGYSAGCDSAKRSGAPHRDEARFTQDKQYAAGWRDGFDMCKRKP